MDPLDLLDDTLLWFSGDRGILLGIPLTLILYFVCRKRSALSWHAIQNIAATVLVAALNIPVALLLHDEINRAAQGAYAALGLPRLPADAWANTPLWLVVVLGLASKDFADYLSHRLMHTRWFWPAHAAHHSDTDVNAFSTYRVHVLEAILMSLTCIVVLTWLQMPQAIPVVAVLSVLHNMYVHMDLDIDHGPLKYVIASPAFHRWHHADVPEAYGKNLANLLPIWDVIFGTYRAPGRCRDMGARSIGMADKNPFLIWIYPFQDWGRLLRRAARRPAGPPDAPGRRPAETATPARQVPEASTAT